VDEVARFRKRGGGGGEGGFGVDAGEVEVEEDEEAEKEGDCAMIGNHGGWVDLDSNSGSDSDSDFDIGCGNYSCSWFCGTMVRDVKSIVFALKWHIPSLNLLLL